MKCNQQPITKITLEGPSLIQNGTSNSTKKKGGSETSTAKDSKKSLPHILMRNNTITLILLNIRSTPIGLT